MSLPPLVAPAAELSPDEVSRYSRHLLLPEIGIEGQQRLKAARVLCVGAGGLGSPALMYLAAAGVGTLGVADFDTVDASNLQRQVVHGQSDVGRSKAESARDRIKEINPHVDVALHQVRLDAGNALEILGHYDIVVDGTDNFATRYLLSDACVLLGIPYVWGSIFRFDGQVSVFWAEHGPCYRCLYPEPPAPGTVPSCAEGGVLGALCGSIGSLQASEATKVITGVGEPLVGRLLLHDGLRAGVRTLPVRKDPECPACGAAPTIRELGHYEALCGIPAPATGGGATISAAELAGMLVRRGRDEEDFVLVDVREPAEYDIVRIPGSVLLPKGEFLSGKALAKLPRDRRVVLHCKSGGRSAEALAVLRDAGYANAVHLGGGVLAWVRDVDPSLPTY